MDLEALHMTRHDPAAAQAALPVEWQQPSTMTVQAPAGPGASAALQTVRTLNDGSGTPPIDSIGVYNEMYGALMCCLRKFIERVLWVNGFGAESELQFAFAAPADQDVATVWRAAGAPGTREQLNGAYLRDAIAIPCRSRLSPQAFAQLTPADKARIFPQQPLYRNPLFYDTEELNAH